jgi:hypothetical protein
MERQQFYSGWAAAFTPKVTTTPEALLNLRPPHRPGIRKTKDPGDRGLCFRTFGDARDQRLFALAFELWFELFELPMLGGEMFVALAGIAGLALVSVLVT